MSVGVLLRLGSDEGVGLDLLGLGHAQSIIICDIIACIINLIWPRMAPA